VPGKKTNYDMTYLTSLKAYRTEITEADSEQLVDVNGDGYFTDASSDEIEAIRLDIDESKQAIGVADLKAGLAPKHEVSSRAYNGYLELYVQYTTDELDTCEESFEGLVATGILNQNDGRCHADIRVWAWGKPYDNSVGGRWCLYHEQSVLTDTLIALRLLPNTKYVVTVSYINGGSVNILEQHTV